MPADNKAELHAADIQKIMGFIPHRYPFLLVDRIREVEVGESCVGIKNVTINEPHFIGHFPVKPVMPGVLLIEGMAQTAAVMCVYSDEPADTEIVYFMSIDKAKFRKPVIPGDQVEYHVKKLHRRGDTWKVAARALVDGNLVAEAELVAMITTS